MKKEKNYKWKDRVEREGKKRCGEGEGVINEEMVMVVMYSRYRKWKSYYFTNFAL